MNRKRIAVIFGTRPEAIKMAPVVLRLRETVGIDCRICVTAQHRQMLDQILDVFGIIPDVDLNLMEPNQTLSRFMSRALESIDGYLTKDKPDVVLVQGDTATVLAGALAAFYHKIPVGHIEAGLRTGNLQSPWPEEMNRVLATRLAKWHFAPTELNRQILIAEGVPESDITVTGNTVIDALFIALKQIRAVSPVIRDLPGGSLDCLGKKKMVLVTGHRRENFGEGFESICHAIADLAEQFPDVEFVYPVHLNPNVREPVERILRKKGAKNIHLLEPQSYLPFVALMNRAMFILTDSGGVQEEAPSLGKPVLVMRDTTERPEAVAAGAVKLVGTDYQAIVGMASQLLTDTDSYTQMAQAMNPYGDGHAVERIVDVLIRHKV